MKVKNLLGEDKMDPEFTVFEINESAYIGIESGIIMVNQKFDFDRVKKIFIHHASDFDEVAIALSELSPDYKGVTVYSGHEDPYDQITSDFYSQVFEKVEDGDILELGGVEFEVLAARKPVHPEDLPESAAYTYFLYSREHATLFVGREEPDEISQFKLQSGSWEDYTIEKIYHQMSAEPVTSGIDVLEEL